MLSRRIYCGIATHRQPEVLLRFQFPQIAPHLRLGWQWPKALSAMRHRNFRLFFIGQLISVSGSWMQSTAQQWLVYRLTGSQLSLGAVTFAGYAPVLVLSLFMGVIVDRFPRRRLLLITQIWFMLLAAALALITFLGIVEYWHILLLATLLGVANALDMPTRQAFYADMVERDDLLNAIVLNSSIFNGGRIIGPALGGLVIASLGEAPAFGLNSLSYLAVITGLLLMRLKPFKPPSNPGTGLTEFKEGLVYLGSDRRLTGLVGMIALLSVFAFPFTVLLPAFARDVLGIGAEGYGALLSSQGVGALLGALMLAFGGDRSKKTLILLLSRILLASAMLAFALSTTPILSMIAMLAAGFAFITQLAVTNTSIQLLVPDELRGRVMSAYTWALAGFWPLGSLLIGVLGDHFTSQTAVLFSSAACFVLIVIGQIWIPANTDME
jgi:MFS family permease